MISEDEVKNEDVTEANPAEDSATEIDLNTRLLAEREEEVASLKDRVARANAETENVRRRLEREKQDAAQYGATSFARDMLSVADNLRRAVEAIPATAREDATVATIITGVEMTEKELASVFQRHGITRIEAIGQPLDPNRHQAMMELDAAEGQEPGTIVQELQAGYLIKERLLRPALVGVAKKG